MSPTDGWEQGKVSLENGETYDGWVRKDKPNVGAIFWVGPHPFGWTGYQEVGWVKVKDQRIVSDHSPKIGQRPADPNDPPLWGMGS